MLAMPAFLYHQSLESEVARSECAAMVTLCYERACAILKSHAVPNVGPGSSRDGEVEACVVL